MRFIFDRNNLALTVFVPWDCENACKFCTSKRSYLMSPANVDRVIYQLRNIFRRYQFPIKDVVISGGEPMMDIRELRNLCMEIPDDKHIYINTTLVNRNLEEFLDFLNNSKKINGVNISRHGNTIEDDRKMLCDIADDSVIQQIKVPVRINCLNGIGDLDRVLNRWSGTGVHLCIREDYRNVKMCDTRNLHDPFAEIPMRLITLGYLFLSHTGCHVCDTLTFEKGNDIVSYHRGLQWTSLESYDGLEINDLVIDQSGLFSYDWGFPKADVLYQLEEAFRKPVDMFRNLENIGIRSKIEYCGSKSGC